MAAPLVVTPAQQELINSLGHDDIPIKLRCAIDSRLAVNAFRLPCCDQSICESCKSTLPTTCPVCEHSPVASDDCKPNKSLRTTIKVFLRTEEKKRETARAKEAQESVPMTPVVDVPPTPIEAPVVEQEIPAEVETVEETPLPVEIKQENTPDLDEVAESEVPKDQQDVPHETIEEISPDQKPVETEGDANAVSEGNENGVVQIEGQHDGQDGSDGVGENAAMAFPGMPMGGDMNQMQMFMAMQNGMGAGGFGNFPMMGMPGMGMDPMTMQNMFMNGGFGAAGGMGMNGMNMGMGMGGFNGGSGAAGFNNWNGQQNSWNVGQDNYNHPNAAGMMGQGDYRANNPGYAPNASGFNQQGNFGRSQFNDFNNNSYGNNNFGYRGRGRGRGGFGRGGYGHQDFAHQQPQNFGQQQNVQTSETGSVPTETKPPAGNVDEFGRELRPASEARTDDGEKPEGTKTITEDGAKDENTPINHTTENQTKGQQEHQDGGVPMPIRSLDEENAAYHQMNGGYGFNGAYSQPYGGRNGFNTMQPPVVKPDVPINAPKGPKAMREGLPNVGFRRQFPPAAPVGPGINNSINGSVRAESEIGVDRQKDPSPPREQSRERSRSKDRKRSRSRERSRERSRDRSRDRHSRRHRHRSESQSEDEKETQRRRERRRERRQRREEEEEARGDAGEEKITDEKEPRDEEERSRSASPSDHKRSSHRSSRREKDKHRDRERDRESDRDREHKSSSHRHRSHRSHREDRSRSRDRERDRDREHRRRHSRRGSVDPDKDSVPVTPVEESNSSSRKHSIASNAFNGIEIKGASSRRKPPADLQQSIAAAAGIPTGPRSEREREKDKSSGSRSHHDSAASSRHHRDVESRSNRDHRDRNQAPSTSKHDPKPAPAAAVDPHTLEREARNRERLLKEAQRIAGMAGGGGRKRSRDDGAEASRAGDDRKGSVSRKKGRRGGVVDEEDEEGRLARLEAERESARWS